MPGADQGPSASSEGQQQGQGQGKQHGDHQDVAAGVSVLIWRGGEVLLEKRAHSHGA